MLVPCMTGKSLWHGDHPSVQVLRFLGLSPSQMKGGMSGSYLGSLHRYNDWLDEGSSQIEGSSNDRVSTALLRLLHRMDTELPSHHEPHDTSQPQGTVCLCNRCLGADGPAGHPNVAGPLTDAKSQNEL